MPEYGNTHKERVRELTETGVSVRHRTFDASGNELPYRSPFRILADWMAEDDEAVAD